MEFEYDDKDNLKTKNYIRDDIKDTIPLPNIYTSEALKISETSNKNNNNNNSNNTLKNKEPIQKLNETTHYNIIWNRHASYDPDTIINCNEKYSCFNCNIKIKKRIYFYPIEETNNIFKCNGTPHCSPECVLRTLHDKPNSHDYIQLFYLMYKDITIVAAPPRELLYGPGSITLQEYRKRNKNNKFYTDIEKYHNVKMFIAPTVLAISLMDRNTWTLQESAQDTINKLNEKHSIFIEKDKRRIMNEESIYTDNPNILLSNQKVLSSKEPVPINTLLPIDKMDIHLE